jgi:hypothetical protein
MYLLMEGLGACINVMHVGNTGRLVIHGEAHVGCVIIHLVLKGGVFYSQVVDGKDMKKVIAKDIDSLFPVQPQHLFLFFVIVCANACVYITTNYDLCVQVDGVQHGIHQ